MKHGMRDYLRAFVVEVTALFGWWVNQLRELLLQALESLVPHMKLRTVIKLDLAHAQVLVLRGGKFNPLFSFRKEPGAQWPLELRHFGSAEVIHNTRAAIALSSDYAIAHELVLPETTESQLDRIIPLYLEREFPLMLSAVSFSFSVVNRLRDARQIVVKIVVVRKAQLDELMIASQAWGLRVVKVGLAEGASGVAGNFIQHKPNTRSESIGGINRWLLISSAALGLLFLAVVGIEWSFERSTVASVLVQAKSNAQIAEKTFDELQSKAAPAVRLAAISRQADAADILNRLTERSPADTWVYQLSIETRQGSVSKLSWSAATPRSLEYIETIERSPEFANVKLVSSASDVNNASLVKVKLTANWSGDSAQASGAGSVP